MTSSDAPSPGSIQPGGRKTVIRSQDSWTVAMRVASAKSNEGVAGVLEIDGSLRPFLLLVWSGKCARDSCFLPVFLSFRIFILFSQRRVPNRTCIWLTSLPFVASFFLKGISLNVLHELLGHTSCVVYVVYRITPKILGRVKLPDNINLIAYLQRAQH